MKKKFKKKLTSLILISGLFFGNNNHTIMAELKNPPKANVYFTRIEEQNNKTNRVEAIVKNLPFNSDIYTLLENYNTTYFNKYRIQTIPIFNKNIGIGLTAQYKTSSFFEKAKKQLGLIGQLQGVPIDKIFGKIELRYFPRNKDIDAYLFLDTSRLYFDIFTGYNLDSHNTFMISGADIKLCKNFSMGIAGNFSGKEKLKKDYIGIRMKLNF